MRVSAIHIRNLCAARDVTVSCDDLTVLVGRNGAGKSTVLRALEIFYASTPDLTASDFYGENVTSDIEIAVTFADLTLEARAQFAGYLEGDTLTVRRVLSLSSGRIVAKYFGETLRHAPFQETRAISGAREFVAKYKEWRDTPAYSELPAANAKPAALDGLKTWETLHPEACERMRDDGQFFGFSEVAHGYLGRYSRLIRVPAVRDAADDASEGKGSPITQLMDLVVRRTLASREELVTLRTEIQAKYKAIIDPAQAGEVAGLAMALSSTLQTYVPDAGVVLTWGQGTNIELPMPRAEVRVREDGHLSPVEKTGHGMQRAFILTMLQHLVCTSERTQPHDGNVECDNEAVPAAPNLILLVEEPELYQHPNRQRHFASTLLRLASGAIPGVAAKTQVLYCTHSPLFVGLERFDQVRVVRKIPNAEGGPKECRIVCATLDRVARQLWLAKGGTGEPFDAQSLRPRLAAIMTPWVNEGFFADAAVLVEGESDRAAILAVARCMGKDLEADGIAVIPCAGKSNLDRPFLIFRALEIPVYLFWDGDKGRKDPKPKSNQLLLKLVGRPAEDFPETKVTDCYTVVEVDLEALLRDELGADRYDRITAEVAEYLGLSGDQAVKNALAVRDLIERAYEEGASSPTLEGLVGQVMGMLGGHPIASTQEVAT